ncbi:MAG: hypothetical protein AAF824_16910 [Bacteroidota bacterium]
MKRIYFQLIGLSLLLSIPVLSLGQESDPTPTEEQYYRISTVPIPEGINLEVGGVTSLPDGSLAVCVRRGDVWIIENPTLQDGRNAEFKLFASGLHEPLGILYKEGSLYISQRGELTKLTDTNGDRIADKYETVYAWPISGHYHEYSFGPKLAPDGGLFVSGNVAFGDEEWWRGESRVPWRGWITKIYEDGTLEPWATGMRSPAGMGMVDGELFYTDNQGDWVGSGGVWHVKKGVFTGHPAGLTWTGEENSPVQVSTEELYERVGPRKKKVNGRYVKPENVLNEDQPDFLYQVKKDIPELVLPAVWLPHGVLGISNSEIVVIKDENTFGPFQDQLLVGDQGQSKIMRVVLEKVNGEYQGVAFDFIGGFQSGVMRMDWGMGNNLFVGETNRGWGSAGTTNAGLQFVSWTGQTPFEMHTVSAKPDGFEITFTKPVDKKLAEDLDSYSGRSYIYKYHPVYGSPPVNMEDIIFKGVKVAEDGMSVRLVVENMRQYHLHEIYVLGLRSAEAKERLLHPAAYYTLNNIPKGKKLELSSLSTKRAGAGLKKKVEVAKPTKKEVVKPADKKGSQASTSKKVTDSAKKEVAMAEREAPTYAEIEGMLVRNACTACHKQNKRVVGPSFQAISKRKYSNERIVELIYRPEPQNWPEYAVPMAAMPQVPRKDALMIAAWINSLRYQ